MAACENNKKNLGVDRCTKLPALPRTMITTGADFKLTPAQMADNALLKTALQDAIVAGKAQRIYLWPSFRGFENVSEEAIYEDTPLGMLFVRDGQYRFRFQVKESLCIHKAMFTHRANKGRAFIYDVENQLVGTLDSEGNGLGFTIQLLNTEKLVLSDGSVSTKSPVFLVLADSKELDEHGFVISASVVNELDKLTDATLELEGEATAVSITVKVFATCDGTPINGLVLADFVLKDAAGDAQVINDVAEEDGTYTLTGAAFVDGTLNLAAPAVLSVKAYEGKAIEIDVA